MTREIKFRAWFVGWKKAPGCVEEPARMVYDIQNGGGLGWQDGFVDYLDEEDYIVEQYTGLKDKNGREIYEGDIICYDAINYQVLWADFYAGFETKRLNSPWNNEGLTLHFLASVGSVIGNIHENPELLK